MLGNANKNRGSSVFASEHNTIKTEIPMMIVELRHVIPARERGGFLPERRNRPPRVVREASTSRLCASRSPLGAPASVGIRASQYRRGWAGLAMKGHRSQFSYQSSQQGNAGDAAGVPPRSIDFLALLQTPTYRSFDNNRSPPWDRQERTHMRPDNQILCAHMCCVLQEAREKEPHVPTSDKEELKSDTVPTHPSPSPNRTRSCPRYCPAWRREARTIGGRHVAVE